MPKTTAPHDNDSAKQRIIDYATQQFFTKGIRNVTMDSISQGLRMSKRTLYQIFADKEQLIIACVEKSMAKAKEQTLEMVNKQYDTIEIFLYHIEEHLNLMDNISEKTVFDIDRYPAVKEHFQNFKEELYAEGAEFIRKGIEDGSLRPETNPDIAIRYIFHNNHTLTNSSDFQGFSHEEIFFSTSFAYLRGCCTQKGQEALDHFYQKYKREHTQK